MNGYNMENSFIPIESKNPKVIYEKCIGKGIHNLGIIGGWILVLLYTGISFMGIIIASLTFLLLFAICYYGIAPSGTRRVYNKSHGSRTASNIAYLLCMCMWFGPVGWIICWLYEKW